jgi:dolichol-phosphate mannosyltransferase
MPSVPLSIVVPCYNEEGCLAELHRRLSAAAQAVTGDAYEIVLINDGSTGIWSRSTSPAITATSLR